MPLQGQYNPEYFQQQLPHKYAYSSPVHCKNTKNPSHIPHCETNYQNSLLDFNSHFTPKSAMNKKLLTNTQQNLQKSTTNRKQTTKDDFIIPGDKEGNKKEHNTRFFGDDVKRCNSTGQESLINQASSIIIQLFYLPSLINFYRPVNKLKTCPLPSNSFPENHDPVVYDDGIRVTKLLILCNCWSIILFISITIITKF